MTPSYNDGTISASDCHEKKMVSVLKCPIVLLHVILRCPCYVIVFTLKTSWILNPTNIFKKAKSKSRRLSNLQLSRFDELAAPDSCSWWTRAKPDVLISCCSLSGPGFSLFCSKWLFKPFSSGLFQ